MMQSMAKASPDDGASVLIGGGQRAGIQLVRFRGIAKGFAEAVAHYFILAPLFPDDSQTFSQSPFIAGAA